MKLKPSPKDKTLLNMSKLKALAEDKFNNVQLLRLSFDSKKRKNGFKHILFSQNVLTLFRAVCDQQFILRIV